MQPKPAEAEASADDANDAAHEKKRTENEHAEKEQLLSPAVVRQLFLS